MNSKVSSLWPRVGRVMAGLILIATGIVLLMYQLGYPVPVWLLTWPAGLIVFGLFVAARSSLRNPAWVVLVTIGGVWLLDEMYPDLDIKRFVWPVLVIVGGLWILFGKRFRWRPLEWHEEHPHFFSTMPPEHQEYSAETLDAVSVFGNTRKNILSKRFAGGEVTTVLGSAEINLSQADIQGRVRLELTQVLGSAKLIVPSHWEIVTTEMVSVLGGIEDKRIHLPGAGDAGKVLILSGTSVLGGLEIHNFA